MAVPAVLALLVFYVSACTKATVVKVAGNGSDSASVPDSGKGGDGGDSGGDGGSPSTGPALRSLAWDSSINEAKLIQRINFEDSTESYDQYCILENSSDASLCQWHTASKSVPNEYLVQARGGAVKLSVILRNSSDGLTGPAVTTEERDFTGASAGSLTKLRPDSETFSSSGKFLMYKDRACGIRNLPTGTQMKIQCFDGQNWEVISDTNPGGSDYPTGLVVHQEKLFFSAFKSLGGHKLFAYDGNSVTQISDVNQDGGSDQIAYLTPVGNKLFFSATPGGGGWYPSIYQYEEGVGVSPVPMAPGVVMPSSFSVLPAGQQNNNEFASDRFNHDGQSFYFIDCWWGPSYVYRWDGSKIVRSSSRINLDNRMEGRVSVVNGVLYLSPADSAMDAHRTLYRWDLIANDMVPITPGAGEPSYSNAFFMTGIGTDVWFMASKPGETRYSLYRYDTLTLKLSLADPEYSFVQGIEPFDSASILVTASDGVTWGTYKVDRFYGTARAPETLLSGHYANGNLSVIHGVMGGALYFGINSNSLYRKRLLDPPSAFEIVYQGDGVVYGNMNDQGLVFLAPEGAQAAYRLVKPSGEVSVLSAADAPIQSEIHSIFEAGDMLYALASNQANEEWLFRGNGDSWSRLAKVGNTGELRNPFTGDNPDISGFSVNSNPVFPCMDDPSGTVRLCSYSDDPQSTGVFQIPQVSGYSVHSPRSFMKIGDSLYFIADTDYGTRILMTDGKSISDPIVVNRSPERDPGLDEQVDMMQASSGNLISRAYDPVTGRAQLFKISGQSSTRLVDLDSEVYPGGINGFAPDSTGVYFWTSDQSGDQILMHAQAGRDPVVISNLSALIDPGSMVPYQIGEVQAAATFGGTLFFAANDGVYSASEGGAPLRIFEGSPYSWRDFKQRGPSGMFIDHAGNLLFSGGSSSGIGVFSYGASSGAGQAVLMDSSTFEDKQVEFFEINGILYGVAVGKGRIARYSEGAWELESASAGGYSGGTFRMTSFKGYTYYVVRISENDYRIVRSAP